MICLWFVGLSGSGKSTIAKQASERLRSVGVQVEVLDGDWMRSITQNYDFSASGRVRNVMTAIELSKILRRNNVLVFSCFMTPYRSLQAEAVVLVPSYLVYVKCPIEVCVARDPKGLYKQFYAGKVSGISGLDATWEEPTNPAMTLETDMLSVDECVNMVVDFAEEKYIKRVSSEIGMRLAKL